MAIQVQHRRGTKAENDAFTGADGELVWQTDTKQFVGHDGATQGGFVLPNETDLINDYFGYASSTGTNTIVLTVLSQISAYQAGQIFTFKAINTISGSATLNVNGIGAITIKKKNPAGPSIDVLAAGDIIIGGIYSVRYDGTDFQLIATDGGGAAPGLELLAVGVASASDSLVFTSLITSAHDVYFFTFEAVRPVTDNRALVLQVSTDNGSSYETSGYLSRSEIYTSTGTAAPTSVNTTFGMLLGAKDNDATFGVGKISTEGISGNCWLYHPLITFQPTRFNSMSNHKNGLGVPYWGIAGGLWTTSTPVDAVRFIFGADAINTAEIKMYGMKASL